MSISCLRMGVARADITPPVGVRSQGFAGRGPLARHHDPLRATALVVADAHRRAALVTCDLIGVPASVVAGIRADVSRRTGIDPLWVTICATHTHYGPAVTPHEGEADLSIYLQNVIRTVGGIIEEAAAAVAPVLIGVGWGASDIGVNRREKTADGRIILGRNPGGFIDRAVGVLRIDRLDGSPLACFAGFQAHPVSQGARMDHVSADYPGQMRTTVEGLTGACCGFLQGACGNINAAIMEHDHESARTLGVRLGCEVTRVWETIKPEPATGLAVETLRVSLPGLRYGSPAQAAELCRDLEAQAAQLKRDNVTDGRVFWAQHRLEKVRAALHCWDTGDPMETIETELQAWRLGPLGLATGPGEIFSQIGAEVKSRSPFSDTFFLAHANDSIGYVPIPAAYAEGGYEVTHACRVDPGAAGIITEGCVQLLNRCFSHSE